MYLIFPRRHIIFSAFGIALSVIMSSGCSAKIVEIGNELGWDIKHCIIFAIFHSKWIVWCIFCHVLKYLAWSHPCLISSLVWTVYCSTDARKKRLFVILVLSFLKWCLLNKKMGGILLSSKGWAWGSGGNSAPFKL